MGLLEWRFQTVHTRRGIHVVSVCEPGIPRQRQESVVAGEVFVGQPASPDSGCGGGW
jgi:hypothetical protein